LRALYLPSTYAWSAFLSDAFSPPQFNLPTQPWCTVGLDWALTFLLGLLPSANLTIVTTLCPPSPPLLVCTDSWFETYHHRFFPSWATGTLVLRGEPDDATRTPLTTTARHNHYPYSTTTYRALHRTAVATGDHSTPPPTPTRSWRRVAFAIGTAPA